MENTFDLLKKYIIENAYEYYVYNLKEYEEFIKSEEDIGPSIYRIIRKPRKTEVVSEATMRKGTTEFTFSCEEEDPEYSTISIANANELYAYQSLTIIKRDGKITIK